jgi:hypothetical protein
MVKKADKSKDADKAALEKAAEAKRLEEERIANTPAGKIWSKIKDLPLDIYALPNQSVRDHAKFEAGLVDGFPDSAHLVLRSAAVKPALEEALGRVRLGQNQLNQALVFELSESAKYTVVKIVPRAN